MEKMSYKQKKRHKGYIFISLWLIGTFLWFVIPAVNSVQYSFRKVNPADNTLGEWNGLKNYMYAFTSDAYYTQYLWESFWQTVLSVPLIVILSLFIAVLLDNKFRFRNFAVSVFFLPVIIASGPVYKIISENISKAGEQNSWIFFSNEIYAGNSVVGFLQSASSEIINLVWYCGIQIIIFLAVLQTIPQSAKEIALVEGATRWEFFWKVTLPYISPAVISNMIFTAVNTFTFQDNKVIKRIIDMQSEWNYDKAAAMAWSYFILIMIFTSILILIFRKLFVWD